MVSRPMILGVWLGLVLAVGGCAESSEEPAPLPGAAAPAAPDSAPQQEQEDLSAAMAQAVSAIEYADANDIGLMARFHFATHTGDFDRARAFYRAIGYTTGTGGSTF